MEVFRFNDPDNPPGLAPGVYPCNGIGDTFFISPLPAIASSSCIDTTKEGDIFAVHYCTPVQYSFRATQAVRHLEVAQGGLALGCQCSRLTTSWTYHTLAPFRSSSKWVASVHVFCGGDHKYKTPNSKPQFAIQSLFVRT